MYKQQNIKQGILKPIGYIREISTVRVAISYSTYPIHGNILKDDVLISCVRLEN